MRIVIFGLTVSSSWGNGHASLWRGLIGALSRLGAQVVFFERDVPYYAAHRDLDVLPNAELLLYSDWQSILPVVRQRIAEADVAIVTSFCPDAIEASRLVARSGALKLFYDLDAPVTLAALESSSPPAYIGPEGLTTFDMVLSYTGGRALDGLRWRLGARDVAPLYGWVDPAVYRPAPPDDQFAGDLSYLGTYAFDRQVALDVLFLQVARAEPRRRFVIGGAQYPDDFPWAENIFYVRHLPPALHPSFYCSARLTLNLTRSAMAALGYCPSGRLFEAAACGATIVSDYWLGLEDFFRPGEEILIVDSTQAMQAMLSLPDRDLRTIAGAARARVLSEHTADHRARELLAIIDAGTAALPHSSARGRPHAAGAAGT